MYALGKNVRYKHPLKTEIYKRGFTISKFADKAQLTRHTLMTIFQRKSQGTRTTKRLIAEALEVPIATVEKLIEEE